MRIAAWTLAILSGLAFAWFTVVVATMLIVPGNDLLFLQNDPHAAAARVSLLLACLALANAVGALLLRKRRRPGALWVVLFAGLLALAIAVWHYAAFSALFDTAVAGRVPDYSDGFAAAAQRSAFFRWLLAWTSLGFSVVGWGAWFTNCYIEIGHGRD